LIYSERGSEGMEWGIKLHNYFSELVAKKDKKRLIEIFATIIVLGIVTIVIGRSFFGGSSKKADNTVNTMESNIEATVGNVL